jgi:flagellar biosynthetic protein FlhB
VFDLLGTLPAFLGLAALAGLAAGIGQVGFLFASKAAQPKLNRLSPKKGLERFKPGPAMWELFRSTMKLGLLALVMLGPIRSWMDDAEQVRGFHGMLQATQAQISAILWRSVLLAIVIAGADYAWNRRRTTKQLQMTKQDVKREHKEQEGDPYLKSRRRQKALEFSRNRMIHEVRTADVVVTNPTHFAVALRYDPEGGAPKIVAKGADRLAARIRKEAYRHGVLVTEDKLLARELHKRCKVGAYVPTHLYEAVALVLAMAYRRRPQLWKALTAEAATAGSTA